MTIRARTARIALLSVLAFAANAAASSATPEILPTPGEKEPLQFTSETSHVVRLGTFVAFVCQTATNEGAFTSADGGKLTLTLHGCSTKSFGKEVLCKTGKEGSGTVVLPFDAWLVTMSVKAELSLGIVMQLPEAVFVECASIKTRITGSVMGKVDGIKAATVVTSGTLNFGVVEGKQEFNECDLLEAVCIEGKAHKQFSLFESIGSPEEPKATLELLEDKMKFTKKFEVRY